MRDNDEKYLPAFEEVFRHADVMVPLLRGTCGTGDSSHPHEVIDALRPLRIGVTIPIIPGTTKRFLVRRTP